MSDADDYMVDNDEEYDLVIMKIRWTAQLDDV